MTERVLLRPEEAAAALGIGRSRMYELLRSREIPSVAVGRSRRVPADALRRWANELLAAQAAEQAPGSPALVAPSSASAESGKVSAGR